MKKFDLRHEVREELNGSAVADPRVVAEHVLKRIPRSDLREALAQALPTFVTNVATSSRRASIYQPKGTASTSARWDTAASTVLSERLLVGKDWKFVGDCTRDEVLEAAAQRDAVAATNMAAADRWRRVAAAMDAHNAVTVADLPTDALAEALS